MGLAKITENLGDGKYKIIIDKDTSEVEDRIDKIETEIADYENIKIPEAETAYTNAYTAFLSANTDFNNKIDIYSTLTKADPPDYDAIATARDNVQDATTDTLDAQLAADTARTALAELKLEKLAKEKALESYQALLTSIENDEREVWAADYTTDLEVDAVVGVAEINGEVFKTQAEGSDQYNYSKLQIYPAGAETDGTITPVKVASEAEAFVGMALKPGWQKWMPTYRHGVITAPDEETAAVDYEKHICHIVLDEAKSTIKTQRSKDDDGNIIEPTGFDINQTTTLSNVPILYMDCNSTVFEEGDHVVIQFLEQDWEQPQVIGFVEEPSACSITIQIQFLSGLVNSEFTAFCDARITDLERWKTNLIYYRDTFIDEILSAIQAMVDEGFVKNYVFGMAVPYTQDDIDSLLDSWGETQDSLADLEDDIDAIIARWQTAKAAATYISSNFKGDISGCADESDNMTGAALLDYIITLGCCPTTKTEPDSTDLDQDQIYRLRDQFAVELIADDLQDACSPVTYLKVYVPSLASFEAYVNAFVNYSAEKIYISASDFEGTITGLTGGWLERLRWTFKLDSENESEEILTYPNTTANVVTTLDLIEKGETASLSMTFGLSGKLMTIPDTFGAVVGTVIPYESYTNPGHFDGDGQLIQFTTEAYSFAQLFMSGTGTLFYIPLTASGANPGAPGIQEQ